MTIIGNLGRDAEIREVNGTRVITFSVAHSEKYRDRNTNLMSERTTWIRCSFWRDPDKVGVAQYLKKGKMVLVEGVPSVNVYVNNQGQPAGSLECRVTELRLLGGGSSEPMSTTPMPAAATPAQPTSSNYPAVPPPEPDFVEDDLPF